MPVVHAWVLRASVNRTRASSCEYDCDNVRLGRPGQITGRSLVERVVRLLVRAPTPSDGGYTAFVFLSLTTVVMK